MIEGNKELVKEDGEANVLETIMKRYKKVKG